MLTVNKLDSSKNGKHCLNYFYIVTNFSLYYIIAKIAKNILIPANTTGITLTFVKNDHVLIPTTAFQEMTCNYKNYQKYSRSLYYEVHFFANCLHMFTIK